MLTDDELKAALSALPGQRVTEEYIKSRIKTVEYVGHEILTICVMKFDNGFMLIGHSAPAAPENYRREIGERYAYDNAFKQAWQLFGFLLRETLYRQGK